MDSNTIGPFSIDGTLAQSRWSVIHICTSPDGRKCALKVFELGDQTADKTAENVEIWRRRFVQERWLLTELAHPHLIEMIHEGEDRAGRPFFVMPFMAANLIGEIGRDVGKNLDVGKLAPRRRPKPVPVARATAILRQILSGVASLHQHGVVHRDLKPGNILMTRRHNGRVRIGDLGMASVQGRTMDVEGEVLGTTGYRAPEISDALSIDPRIDVYSIGAIAQRMLSGLPVRHDSRRLGEIMPDLPSGLVRIVERARSDDPAARYVDAIEMSAELEKTAGNGPL